MDVTSSRSGLCVVIASVVLSASCNGDASEWKGTTQHSPCPTSSADATLVNRVHAAYAPIELRLPDGMTPRPTREATRREQGWTGATGLAVSYAVHAEPVPERDPARGDRQFLACSERIGGKVATIRLLYSEQTTAPGQYVVARWVLDSGETLLLTATHPDSSRRGELLSIVRSVRFLDPIH